MGTEYKGIENGYDNDEWESKKLKVLKKALAITSDPEKKEKIRREIDVMLGKENDEKYSTNLPVKQEENKEQVKKEEENELNFGSFPETIEEIRKEYEKLIQELNEGNKNKKLYDRFLQLRQAADKLRETKVEKKGWLGKIIEEVKVRKRPKRNMTQGSFELSEEKDEAPIRSQIIEEQVPAYSESEEFSVQEVEESQNTQDEVKEQNGKRVEQSRNDLFQKLTDEQRQQVMAMMLEMANENKTSITSKGIKRENLGKEEKVEETIGSKEKEIPKEQLRGLIKNYLKEKEHMEIEGHLVTDLPSKRILAEYELTGKLQKAGLIITTDGLVFRITEDGSIKIEERGTQTQNPCQVAKEEQSQLGLGNRARGVVGGMEVEF